MGSRVRTYTERSIVLYTTWLVACAVLLTSTSPETPSDNPERQCGLQLQR